MVGLVGARGEPLYPPESVADQTMELSVARARIAELEAEINFVREKINDYIRSNFDPGMMGQTLDDIRHHLHKNENA